MPAISVFYGISIYLYANDHNPPHFHVRYAEYNATVDIHSGELTEGKLPPRARLLIEEWRIIHQKEILESFELMVKYHQVKKIEGLK
jgi:hypothetical protein